MIGEPAALSARTTTTPVPGSLREPGERRSFAADPGLRGACR
jgi:hypothetical protein